MSSMVPSCAGKKDGVPVNDILIAEAKMYLRRIINETSRLDIAKEEPDLIEYHANKIRDLARATLATLDFSVSHVQVEVEQPKELPW